jgi:hypothetical protein
LEAKIIDVLVAGWSLRLVLRPRAANQRCQQQDNYGGLRQLHVPSVLKASVLEK